MQLRGNWAYSEKVNNKTVVLSEKVNNKKNDHLKSPEKTRVFTKNKLGNDPVHDRFLHILCIDLGWCPWLIYLQYC
jgi:hypothetical protein